MQVDIFREILVPVLGGLGIFMLGLEFMSDGIHNLAVNKMRAVLGKIAGTPVKGLVAGTLITGVLQSSTAMTVMVVGLVNAGVVGLRPAISVIMGANIGTTGTGWRAMSMPSCRQRACTVGKCDLRKSSPFSATMGRASSQT